MLEDRKQVEDLFMPTIVEIENLLRKYEGAIEHYEIESDKFAEFLKDTEQTESYYIWLNNHLL